MRRPKTTVASDETARTTEKPTASRKEARASPGRVPAGDLCQSQLGGFVGSMDGLRRRLAVGVTYDQYVAEVRGIRSTYGEIPTEQLRDRLPHRRRHPRREGLQPLHRGGQRLGRMRLRSSAAARPKSNRCCSAAGGSPRTSSPKRRTGCRGLSGSRPKKRRGRPKAALAWCIGTNAGTAAGWDKVRSPYARRCPGWIPPGAQTSAAPSGPAPPESLQACDSR